MVGLFDMLFGCCHKHCSFPITAKKGTNPNAQAGRITGTYVVCLECGKEFPYDWEQMKVLPSHPEEGSSLAAKAAARLAKVA
jgi:hypothetical protein